MLARHNALWDTCLKETTCTYAGRGSADAKNARKNGRESNTTSTKKGRWIIESWRHVWRDGVAPLLSIENLLVLRNGLLTDDKRLMQGATTDPPPLRCVQDWPVEGACALAYCGWQSEGLNTVAEVEEFFAQKCFDIDSRLGEPAGCRWWLNWWDETPRDNMRALMIGEINRTLSEREQGKEESCQTAQ